MAEPLPIDRELVKALWLQGFDPKQIQDKTGVKRATLRTWIARLGWRREGLAERNANKAAEPANMQAVAARFASLTVSQTERIIECIRDSPVKTLGDCKTAASALAASYATARKALGLDDSAGVSTHLHYHVMRDCRSSFAAGAVVDVEATVAATAEPAAEQSAAPSAPSPAPGDAAQPPSTVAP